MYVRFILACSCFEKLTCFGLCACLRVFSAMYSYFIPKLSQLERTLEKELRT